MPVAIIDYNFSPGAIYADAESPKVTLGQVLSFFSGAEYPPPLGFNIPPAIYFSATNVFPQASTCALTLTLPTKYFDQPESFEEKMIYALKNHGGFGLL